MNGKIAKSSIVQIYQLLLALFIVSNIHVQAHSWMTNPKPREERSVSGTNADNYKCDPNRFGSAGVATYTRGQAIKVEWLGNNHISGFVQLAIAPKAQAGEAGVFQKQENIVMISCYRPKACPRNGPEFGDGSPRCTQTMNIPRNLPDGEYSLQWVQYGSGDSNGVATESLPDYISCHDFRINGGEQGAGITCPAFFGGDISGAGDGECSFYTTNAVGNNNIINVPNAKELKKAPPKYIETCRNSPSSQFIQSNITSANISPMPKVAENESNNASISNMQNQLAELSNKLNQLLGEMRKIVD